jgi:hypothetical protein
VNHIVALEMGYSDLSRKQKKHYMDNIDAYEAYIKEMNIKLAEANAALLAEIIDCEVCGCEVTREHIYQHRQSETHLINTSNMKVPTKLQK